MPEIVFAESRTEDVELFTTDFTNLSEYICEGEDYYFVNSSASRIVKINSDSELNYLEFGGDTGKLFYPKLISHISNIGFFIYDQLKRVQLFSNDFEYLSVINLIDIDSANGVFYPLGDVSDMTADCFGKLYLLDRTNNAVLIKNSDYQFLTVMESDSLLISETSKIAVSYNSSILAVANAGDDIFLFNEGGSTSLTHENEISDIYFDCANNLFVFEREDNQCRITRYNASDDYEKSEEQIFEIDDYLTCFLEQETGNITFLTAEGIKVVMLENFTANALYFEPPVDFNQPVALEEQIKIGETNKTTKLLQTPTSISAYIPLASQTQILILAEDIPGNEPFAYCYFENGENGYFGYLLKTDYDNAVFTPINSGYKTFYSNVKLYRYPTASSPVLLTVVSEMELAVLNNCSGYKDAFDNGFYAVQYQNEIYYVNTMEVISTDLFEASPLPQTEQDESFQLTAYLLIILCLFLTTIYVIVKISKKAGKAD